MSKSIGPIVHFQKFKRYEDARQRANNAAMAFLVGSALATDVLGLVEGSSQKLPEIFPNVRNIKYVKLHPEKAQEVLKSAPSHLGAMTVPYGLSLHEDFIMTCIRWLRESHNIGNHTRVGPKKMHQHLWHTIGANWNTQSRVAHELFDLLRNIRNCNIHAGGVVGNELRRCVYGLSTDAVRRWKKLTGRTPVDMIGSGRAQYEVSDVLAVFAITRDLGRHANVALRDGVPAKRWLITCVQDYHETASYPPRSDNWGRGLVGHAKMDFKHFAFTEADLFEEAARAGLWSRADRRPEPRRSARMRAG